MFLPRSYNLRMHENGAHHHAEGCDDLDIQTAIGHSSRRDPVWHLFYLFLSFFFSFCADIHRCHINISSAHDGGLRLLQHVGVLESSVCESRFDSAQLRCVGGRTEAGVIAPKIANISPSSEIPVGIWLP